MHAPRLRSALLATALMLACASGYALAADCGRAIAAAMTVADHGQRAFASNSQAEAVNFASDARIPAIDAAQQAKACGCPEAMPFLAEAARDAARSNATANGTAAQQYGASIRKNGDAALDALHRCAAR
jgi:hypothetical protein